MEQGKNRRKRKSVSNPAGRQRMTCEHQGCKWEGEFRGYRGHHKLAHGVPAPMVEPATPGETITMADLTPPQAVAPASELAGGPPPPEKAQECEFEREMGY